jgi:ribosomal protein L11 methyltransferase
MEWTEVNIFTAAEGIELLCSKLMDIGVKGFVIKDSEDFNEFLENKNGQWDYIDEDLMGLADCETCITVYLPGNEQGADMLQSVRAMLAEMKSGDTEGKYGRLEAELASIREEDWANNWKQYFHQFMVDDILIIPSWEDVEPEQEASMVLRIDPGIAFGTGKHESTQLAIRGLRKYLKDGMRVLDIGTGSGILGIIALKSGASYVLGTDLDVNTLEAIAENIEKNEVDPESFAYVIGNIQDDPAIQEYAGGDYDIVVANIIAEILAGITPVVPNHLKKGGIYITSGILITHAQVVRDAMAAAGLTIIEENEMGEWESIVARLD